MRETTIYCSSRVRELWPTPLALQWARLYAELFDAHDVRLTRSQPKNHFAEWFAAIHLFQRDGVRSLVEKYVYRTHTGKRELLVRLFTPRQRAILDGIRLDFGVQPPDLPVYTPDLTAFAFAEVKGPGDHLRASQRLSHVAIQKRLGVSVEIVVVRLARAAAHPAITADCTSRCSARPLKRGALAVKGN